MSELTGLGAGDAIVVKAGHSDSPLYRTVTKVGRLWLYDNHNRRYRITDGRTSDAGYADEAMPPAEWDAREEVRLLAGRLRAWGWNSPKTMPLHQLRRAAALLSEFDSEKSGGLL